MLKRNLVGIVGSNELKSSDFYQRKRERERIISQKQLQASAIIAQHAADLALELFEYI